MRLTYNPCDDCDYSYSKNNQEMNECRICEFQQCLSKCIEYETLEEEGKLLKLPVAPGITIYIIRYKWTTAEIMFSSPKVFVKKSYALSKNSLCCC